MDNSEGEESEGEESYDAGPTGTSIAPRVASARARDPRVESTQAFEGSTSDREREARECPSSLSWSNMQKPDAW
jgi:hypothetical protein